MATRLSRRVASDLDAHVHPLFFGASRPDFDGLPEPVRTQMVESQSSLQLAHYHKVFADLTIEIFERSGAPVARLITGIAPGDSALTLVDIVVLPQGRNSGFGAEIVGELQARATGEGRSIKCSVHHSNPGSLRFHQRLGFEVIRESEDRWHLEWSNQAG